MGIEIGCCEIHLKRRIEWRSKGWRFDFLAEFEHKVAFLIKKCYLRGFLTKQFLYKMFFHKIWVIEGLYDKFAC